ncbi:MAG: hypothetical protein KGH58_04020 [Candidatus Micrarchaeota archaeon]|nr:hypothetical protein [Candidatus Micrarchaeota archaeon]
MRHVYEVAFLALSIVAALSMGASSSASFTANITVFCPYNILVSVQPSYAIIGNVAASFSVQSLSSACTNPSATGFLTIINNANNKVAYQNAITVNEINTVLTSYDFQFPTSNLTNTVYKAKVNLTSASYTNSSSPTFQALNPPTLLITNFSASPGSPSKGSDVTFFADITNGGQYATSNIPVNLIVSGPAASTTNVVLPALSPYQEENVVILLSGVTPSSGTYQATMAANTIFNGVNIVSNTASLSYTVPGGGGGGGGGGTTPTGPGPGPTIVQMPQLTVVSAPLFTSLAPGTSAIYSMTFQSSSTSSELVTFGVGHVSFEGTTLAPVSGSGDPRAQQRMPVTFAAQNVSGSPPSFYNGLVTLSTKSLVLGPGQSSTINLFFNAPANATPGTYVIPLNVSITAANVTHSQVQYLTFTIAPQSAQGTSILNQITLLNNTNTASGVIKVTSPYNNTRSNLTLQTLIPVGVAVNASQIVAFGAPATITVRDQYYVITWNIGVIPPGQQIYAYYTITRPQNQQLLQKINNIFVAPQAPAPQNLLKVLDINIPTYYTNTTDQIEADVLYTGTAPGQVSFSLTGPPGVVISDSYQSVSVGPNQQLAARFDVTAPSTPGTSLLSMVISQGNTTLSYSIPLIVLPQQAQTTAPSQQLPPLPISISMRDVAIGVGAVVVVALAYVAVRIGRQGLGRPRYKKDRSEQLIRIREQIKRSDQVE